MRVPFPLSLKITVWLLLNLLVLAVAACALLVEQGGLSWNSLVRGPAGNRAQQLGSTIVGEFTAADTPEEAREVLAYYESEYKAQLTLLHPMLPGATRAPAGLPAGVVARLEEGRPEGGRGGPGRRGGPPGLGPPGRSEGRGGGRGGRDGQQQQADEVRGRFLVRTEAPDDAFWVGVRVLVARPMPATLVMRVDSWWGLMRLLDLQPWLIAGGSIAVFSIAFWLPLVLGITRDLKRLTAATERIAEGRFETRVATGRRDEIGHLGESVNLMAGRLDTLVNGQKRFLGDVAHELGSPLARLQLAVEILESRSEPALREQIADVRDEVHQMTALVNELLAFTQAGLRPRATELAVVELAPLVRDTLAREDPAGRIASDIPADLRVRADAPLLARALANLARNALRHAGDGGAIAITATRERAVGPKAGGQEESGPADGRIHLLVTDQGPGVPPEALPRLGEPFYRPELARTRETGGVGLGLAIVRSAVAACGGEVHFANREPKGFQAELRLVAA